MDVLILGGTVFLGRAVAAQAQSAGHRVTVFNRGRSGPTPDGAEAVAGDRTDPADLQRLSGRHFDLVVDTCGYVPADVTLSAGRLAGHCDHYAFVSTINVFPGWPEQSGYEQHGIHAGDPDATRADVPAGLDEGQDYGWLKAGCELAVLRAFGSERCSVLRGGCIVGPQDGAVARLPWWIDRVARGGKVLVPGAPDDPVALIDARDLAEFALCRAPGTFQAAGPARDNRADLMRACRDATGSNATFTYVGDRWPLAQGVTPWTELPLWVPDAPGLFRHDTADAQAAGLRWRPLADTVADTWAWQRALPAPGWTPSPRTPGLDPGREAELLAAFATLAPMGTPPPIALGVPPLGE